MKIIFVCNTLYQVIVATAIKKALYSTDECDIVLSDHTVGMDDVCKRMQNNKDWFENAYYIKTKHMYNEKISKIKKIKRVWFNDKIASDAFDKYKYDIMFCANSEPFSNMLYNYLHMKNRKLKIFWYEDGLGTYCLDYDMLRKSGGLRQKIYKVLFNYQHVEFAASKIFLFNPAIIPAIYNKKIVKIPYLNEMMDDSYRNYLNKIFGYDNLVDEYNRKYIFFEDGFVNWETVNDIELLEYIASLVGKENVMVKIHPRNPKNRFKDVGFKTNADTAVPWEIIALNMNLNEKTLVTMYSQAVLTPYILFGEKTKIIILSKLGNSSSKSSKRYYDFLNKNFYEKEKNIHVVKSLQELKEVV